ncbi:hypothetical protein D3C87_1720440 [compost metagenome]
MEALILFAVAGAGDLTGNRIGITGPYRIRKDSIDLGKDLKTSLIQPGTDPILLCSEQRAFSDIRWNGKLQNLPPGEAPDLVIYT